ncbi:MAG: DNA-binding response OmpR family regulator [Sulfitobacter sp.]|jgi:DNA-binding response OmpR family regulator
MRLLAVDDDPLILDLLPIVFKQADLPDITLANNGSTALQHLRDPDVEYDCLLLDVEMPQMDGITLCERIRALPRYRNTPILMLTSVTDHTRIERAFAAGANDYITKPFDVKEIVTRVRVARRMSETTDLVPRLDPLDTTLSTEAGHHAFDVSDPIRITHLSQLILPFSLGNYLSQLSRRRLDSCTIFATRVEGAEALFERCKTHEFAIALNEVAEAITEVVDCSDMLMTYQGDGLFLSILQGSEAPAWPNIEDQIHNVLDEGAAIYDDGTPMALSVSVGNPVIPNASRNQRVKKTFDRAIGRALMREKSKAKQGRLTAANRKAISPGVHLL